MKVSVRKKVKQFSTKASKRIQKRKAREGKGKRKCKRRIIERQKWERIELKSQGKSGTVHAREKKLKKKIKQEERKSALEEKGNSKKADK